VHVNPPSRCPAVGNGSFLWCPFGSTKYDYLLCSDRAYPVFCTNSQSRTLCEKSALYRFRQPSGRMIRISASGIFGVGCDVRCAHICAHIPRHRRQCTRQMCAHRHEIVWTLSVQLRILFFSPSLVQSVERNSLNL